MAYETAASLALSPEQQAEILALIEPAGLDISEFMWMFQPNTYHPMGPLVSALVHTSSGHLFRFEFLETARGNNRVSVWTNISFPNGRRAAACWEDQLGHVREWLMRMADVKE